MVFKIRGSDGNDYGPVSAEVVLQWIAANRLSRQSLAQAEGSTEWKPLSEFPEFQGALSAQSTPPPPVGGYAASYPPPGEPRRGMAITSLVLGIASITCLTGFAAIPAIILGHIAHHRSRKYPTLYGGPGMAVAGLVMGYISLLLLPVTVALLLPALAKAKDRALKVTCVNQMKSVDAAVRQYTNEHNNNYPPNLLILSNQVAVPKLLVCPADTTRRRRESWNDVMISGSSYIFTVPATGSPQEVVLRCPVHGNVAHADGSVTQGTEKPGSGQ
ncbi:MAG TPA: DUF4190 domain-containing protein [Candidatus Binatia bacterium]|nr:DUF4190 domain-containing protein [Candidatus Binatia bacterium]